MKRILTLAVILAPTVALAHPGHDGGIVAGLVHPFSGLDHLLAMTGIGLWAALQGGRAIWALPMAFLAAMALGLGLATPAMPAGLASLVEPAVLASVILLGATLALALRMPLAWALPAVGVMGLAHGAAHSMAQGAAGSAADLGQAAAILLATGLLHGLGLGLGAVLPRGTLRLVGVTALLAGIGLTAAV